MLKFFITHDKKCSFQSILFDEMGIFIMCYKKLQSKVWVFTLKLYNKKSIEMRHELDSTSLASSVNNLRYILTERAKQPVVSSCTNVDICFVQFRI